MPRLLEVSNGIKVNQDATRQRRPAARARETLAARLFGRRELVLACPTKQQITRMLEGRLNSEMDQRSLMFYRRGHKMAWAKST